MWHFDQIDEIVETISDRMCNESEIMYIRSFLSLQKEKLLHIFMGRKRTCEKTIFLDFFQPSLGCQKLMGTWKLVPSLV